LEQFSMPTKIFTELTYFAATASASDLKQRVRALEDAGSSGISMWDHIFSSAGAERYPCDPLTSLAAIAAITDTLELQTIVMNSAWIHPGLLLRQFAQLAVLVGGERVTAGLGAGWSFEEFEAMGMEYPDFAGRMARFEDVISIAHQLYHDREANLEGNYFSAVKLPLVPSPAVAPQILVGGGGERTLRLAARYADKLDLIQSPKVKKVGPKPTTMAGQHNQGQGARGRTVVADLRERVDTVHGYMQEVGRRPEELKICVQANYALLCRNAAEVEQADRKMCAEWFHIPYQSLEDNPYVLRGEPRQIADTIQERAEKLGLYQITIQENQDSVEFCSQVTPLL
jgi:alkanesulfonate monooxygenase SsuD/methylene tetrahydromethanopterin reductase-like flavin-dependent oxidoreductase (luciferase family)